MRHGPTLLPSSFSELDAHNFGGSSSGDDAALIYYNMRVLGLIPTSVH